MGTARSLLIFLVAALVLAGCGKLDPRELLTEALEAARHGDRQSWLTTRELLKTCRDEHGVNDPDVDALYVYALWRTDEQDQAIQVGRKLADSHPQAFAPQFILGKFYYGDKDYQNALTYLRQAHALQPEHVDCLLLYASCAGLLNLDNAGDLYEALDAHEQYRDTGTLSNERAVWHAGRGDTRGAFSHVAKALDLSDHHPLIWLNKARIADFYANKPSLARKFYRQFLLEAGERYKPQREHAVGRMRALKSL